MTPRRIQISIRTKLVGATAILIATIVTILTWYFPSREINALREEHHERVSIYGELLSAQVRSAVAFADQETAREILASLNSDLDIVAVTLFTDGGDVLYAKGTPSSWVDKARGVAQKRVVEFKSRVVAAVPVISLEGPRGTLVIELSMSSIDERQVVMIWTAVAIGGITLLFGVFCAALIGRSFTRRLRAIAELANGIATGSNLPSEVATDGSRDEIGSLASAFNSMMVQLRTKQERLEGTIRDLQEAEEKLATSNRELESRVDSRTFELRNANVQLQAEMKQRAKIELELRQAQKLESVGRLAAGIAHEINTPIQYISDSVAFVGTAMATVQSTFAGRRELGERIVAGTIELAEAVAILDDAEVNEEMAFLMEHIPEAISRATEGLTRVANIVKGMKEFAYADSAHQTSVDLNRAILNTLTIASNEYKYVADVQTDLGDLPYVTCHLGEFNQVILNMIVNSAHAIEMSVHGSGRRGKITVRTREVGQSVEIEIEDDGCGIPATLIDKIYDPFFTTKEIGKGSGQGLAIAHAVIVDKHKGSLDVRSHAGAGTAFTIRLPIGGAQPVLAMAS